MRLENEARSSFTEKKKKQVQMKAQKRLNNTKEDLWSKEDKLKASTRFSLERGKYIIANCYEG